MGEPVLQDPRYLYQKNAEDDQQEQIDYSKWAATPECGEESYEGNHKLENRRVLITGADSGIGRAVAIAFAREGADIALHFLPGEEDEAQEVAECIEKAGRKALLLPYDFRDETAPAELIQKTVAAFGGLDTLVLNAAQQVSHPSIETISIQQVKDTFMVNIISMFALVKEAVPHLPPGSSIITTTSLQAYEPSTNFLDYAATKSAIGNFTINLAKQLADKGIRVNGIAPGPIWTPLQLGDGQPKDGLSKFGQDCLLERAGQPMELAPVYVFLASNDASYVTAQIYGVTGGAAINL
ncbi:SDR family oxidoreductase [Enterococcus mediterraneensis]|uniref:SDR family oxidoreductase n=1 Tax=Enterococcus mediterraneensis TaxID=2364791 RepID=UPI000F04B7E8|nr:SDR family oxidoreductase [Enterococcus mediterraneensis]